MTPIQLAYAANLVLLIPVAIPTLVRLFPTDQGRFEESSGWRILVGALWTAIMILSLLGLRSPLIYSPVLLLQMIYKTLWLAFYAAPRLLRGQAQSIPWGIAGSFLCIAFAWPWIIPWAYLLGD